jgi:hypothetical protein
MIYAIVSDDFTNLQHVERCKTYVSGLTALFRGTKVMKHPFSPLDPNDVCECLDDFTNLQHVKRCKTCVALFRGTKVVKHPF